MAKNTVEKIPKSDTSVIVIDTKSINKHLDALDNIFDAFRKEYFFAIGFGLYWFDDTGAYRQIDNSPYKPYDNIADFAKSRYGISKATTYQYLAVIKKFGQINPETGEIDSIQDEYKNYKSTALIIMSGMTDEQLAKCNPNMKTKELKAIRDGLPLEDKTGNQKKSEPKKDKPKQSVNSENLYTLRDMEDYETYSREILKCIRNILKQNDSVEYRIDISMVWD